MAECEMDVTPSVGGGLKSFLRWPIEITLAELYPQVDSASEK